MELRRGKGPKNLQENIKNIKNKLGFSSRNQRVTGSIPFLNIAQRNRHIHQQKIQRIKTFSRRWDNCIIYKQRNHKWAIEALQNKY